jgi:broad specificity phosphatase PhoE
MYRSFLRLFLLLTMRPRAASSLSVTILRHAETEWNVRGMLQGSMDSPLTERGEEQARLCGERLQRQLFTTCYTSPLPRARRTAELVLRRMDQPPPIEEEDRLRERAFGDWEGLRWPDIQERFPEEVAKSKSDADYEIAGGGESRSQNLARALDFLAELPLMHSPDERVLVVTHSATAVTIVKHVLGLSQGSRECAQTSAHVTVWPTRLHVCRGLTKCSLVTRGRRPRLQLAQPRDQQAPV